MVNMVYRLTFIFAVLFLASGVAQGAYNSSSAHPVSIASQLGAFKYENHLLDQAIFNYDDGDYDDALTKFMLLSSSQNADAEYYLGMMHQYGLGVAVNKKIALYWFGRAAKNKHAEAANMLRRRLPKDARLKNDTTKINHQ
jgi:TPR repeat protein